MPSDGNSSDSRRSVDVIRTSTMNKWWLSFCDPSKPKGQQFLGVCIVLAPHFIAAIKVAAALGINPGGEVRGYEMPGFVKIGPQWLEKLLTREECEAFEFEQAMVYADGSEQAHEE